MSRSASVQLVGLLLASGCSFDWDRFDPGDKSGQNISGLVLFLPFDEATGTETREVVSGRDAELRGATFIEGVDGSAVRLVPDDHVFVPLPVPLDVHMEFTVAAWVRVPEGATGTIASNHGDPHWLVRYSVTPGDESELAGIAARPDYGDWPTYELLGPRPVADVWQHVAFTVDGADLALYVNASLLGTRRSQIPPREPDPDPFCYLGISGYGHFTDPLTGDIDEFRVYDRPLTVQEIEVLATR